MGRFVVGEEPQGQGFNRVTEVDESSEAGSEEEFIHSANGDGVHQVQFEHVE